MLYDAIDAAISFRKPFFESPPVGAFRLLNGFTEGCPGLAIDIFAKTAVVHDYADDGAFAPQPVTELLQDRLPWLKAVVWKKRRSDHAGERNGTLLYGVKPDDRIEEHGVRYALQLLLNRDNSFYADTRNLRKWLRETMRGKRVLNTFAYTGSLGIAAAAGGAIEVLQTDLSDKFLSVAQRSSHLNNLPVTRKGFLAGDFFPVVARLKREERRFDCVILDPPFFSDTAAGRVDLAYAPAALLNKVRPLVAHDGYLVAVNNSLYLSGHDFLAAVDALCDGVYLKREAIVPVPEDFTGGNPEYRRCYQVDPAPFNHPTKIVILRVARKDAAG